ncbi:MAG: hypothetical protein HYU77_15570 [Betaproteobacteria bacterium]|nr:hypothetical protein [Betaproteobacteria bacterium]
MTNESQVKPHFTTRRGFIAAAGFGVVGLYFLWAGYGAAPLNIFAGSGESQAPAGGGHGGGHGAAAGPSVEEFRSAAESFIESNKLPDGSVMPRRQAMAEATSMEQMDHAAMGHGPQAEAPAAADKAAKAQAPMDHGGTQGGHGETPPAAGATEAHAEAGPTDIYLMAYQWGYQPAVLRLQANVPYRFRMMALDMTHGASLQLGAGSRIIRLRPGALVEQSFTFTRPGEYLLYCTVYCGMGHDRMQGKIIVTANQPQESSHESASAH